MISVPILEGIPYRNNPVQHFGKERSSLRIIRVLAKFYSVLVIAGLGFWCSAGKLQGAGYKPGELRFDAGWWLHASSDEQQGFIFGYLDCRQQPNAAKASINDYQKAVSKAMKGQKATHPTSVANAIEEAWKTLTPQKIDKSAEVYVGPHGFLDGEWWGEFSGSWPLSLAEQDQGYLEGYLECRS